MTRKVFAAFVFSLSFLITLSGCAPAAPAAQPTAALGPAVAQAASAPAALPTTAATAVPMAPAVAGPTGKRLAGQVLWGSSPVAGVRVELRRQSCRLNPDPNSAVAATVSDVQGQYEFLEPPAGDYVLCATWPDGEENQGGTPAVQIAAGQEIAGPETTLRLLRAIKLLEPAAGAEVQLAPGVRWEEFPGISRFHVLIVNAGTVIGTPPLTAACRAVICPAPACRTCPMIT